MPKRKIVSAEPGSKKRRKAAAGQAPDEDAEPMARAGRSRAFQDGESIREQARPYRLATAQMPLSALTTTWSLGQNRPLDLHHVRRLSGLFRQGGLNRRAEENHVLVLCRRDQVDRMVQHLRLDDVADGGPPLAFDAWLALNNGQPAEVMASQHRIKALEDYVAQTGAGAAERWWTCEFYDRDTLPADLNLRLRVNRQDLALADTHGQVWLQVAAAASQNPPLFEGRAVEVERRVIDILQLGSTPRFPTPRLVSVWRNERWRAMTTRWCQTSVGKATFQISTWDWMVRYRIDDFWFSAFDGVLAALSALPGDAAGYVAAADWKTLCSGLPADRTEAQVADVFYPGQPPPPPSQAAAKRRPGLLSALDDGAFWNVYRHIASSPRLRFPNIHRLLRLSKDDGRILYQVVYHVATWLGLELTLVTDRRVSYKPPLRDDLVPALQHWTDALVDKSAQGLAGFRWHQRPASAPEAASVLLQHEVLELAIDGLAHLRSPAGKAFLEQTLAGCDGAQYARRFSNGPWREMLGVVRRHTRDDLRAEWTPAADKPAASPRVEQQQPAAELTESLCRCLLDTPLFIKRPVLPRELDSEPMRQILYQWVARALATTPPPVPARDEASAEENRPPAKSPSAVPPRPPSALSKDSEAPRFHARGIPRTDAPEGPPLRPARRTLPTSPPLPMAKKRTPSWRRGPRAV